MKVTMNLAARPNQIQHRIAAIARRTLPLLVCWLACLMIVQGLAVHRYHGLQKDLAKINSGAPAEKTPARNILAQDYERQADEILFINGLIAKDQFSWIELLSRLETTLTNKVMLTSIQPDYQQRSLQLTGMAEDVDSLKLYLTSLLQSDSFATAYLLQQDTRKIKDSYGREHLAVAFSLEIQKAF